MKFHSVLSALFTLFAGLALTGCEYLMDPNLLAKSSDETDDFKCTLSTPDQDGIFKGRSYSYTARCEAKQGRVRFINLQVAIVATEDNRSRSLGEGIIAQNAVVTTDRAWEHTGSISVQGASGSGRRSLHLSATIAYPDEPELEYEADQQEKINNPWRYNLLVVERL